jgi:hypothetical protein
MTFQIDDAFIAKWHPKYDETENDESEYQKLVAQVSEEMRSSGTIGKRTFLDIWRWKGASRAIRHVRMEDYERYQQCIARVVSERPERKLDALVGLPGVGAPTASTLIHFIHPDSMPIIDVRTAETLSNAGLIRSKRASFRGYEEFQKAISSIRQRCRRWNLREIDRALFAYHKQVLGGAGNLSCA